MWFTVFGNLAIWLDVNRAAGNISTTVAENMPIALFTVFDYLPWSTVLAWVTGFLVAVYFVTASDAGALVSVPFVPVLMRPSMSLRGPGSAPGRARGQRTRWWRSNQIGAIVASRESSRSISPP